MDRFEQLHPLTILGYYISAVVIMVFYGHPLLTALVFITNLSYYASRNNVFKGGKFLLGGLGTAMICIIINPLFNHRGVTLLFEINNIRITKEAVLYGENMALMLVASLLLFFCFSQIMTAEKIMTLMGKHFPAFSLLFSMILRFVPKAGKDVKEMTALHGNRPVVWSALIGISLEDAMERSISMKGRKFGKKKNRTSYYWKKLSAIDLIIMVVSFMSVTILLVYCLQTGCKVRFFPSVYIETPEIWFWALMIVFYGIPLGMRGKEELSWQLSRRKITNSITRNSQNQR